MSTKRRGDRDLACGAYGKDFPERRSTEEKLTLTLPGAPRCSRCKLPVEGEDVIYYMGSPFHAKHLPGAKEE